MEILEARTNMQRLGQRRLLACDLVGAVLGAAIAVTLLVTVVS